MSSLDARFRPFLLTWALPAGLVAMMAVALGGMIAWMGGTAYILVPGMLGVIAVALIGIRYERVPFYLLVASLALGQLLSVEELPTTLLIVPGSLAIVAWLSKLVFHQTSLVVDRRSVLLVLALGFWATLSAFNAGAISTARTYWLVVILFLLTPNVIREEKHFVELGWVLTISLGMVGGIILFTLTQVYLTGVITSGQALHGYAQREVIFGVSGILGMRLTKAIPFALYIAFVQRGVRPWQRYLLVLCTIVISLAILSAVSLSAIFGLAGTFLLVVLWVREHSQRFWLILVVGLVLLAGSSLLIEPVAERVADQLVVVEQEDPLAWGTQRGLSWYIGLELIRQAPLLGQGPGESAEASLAYVPGEFSYVRGKGGVVPHNIFLSLGAEVGVPGMLLFIALLISIMVPLWREVRRQHAQTRDSHPMISYMGQATLIGLVMLLAQGMGIPVHLDKYLWLLLGTGIAFLHMTRSKHLAHPAT